jgi:hypothetical protein
MSFKMTSTPQFIIPQLKPFQNEARLNFWGGTKHILITFNRLMGLDEILYGGDDTEDD